MRGQFLAVELDGEIRRLASDRIGGINRAGGIDEKSGAGKFAVLDRQREF